MPAHKNLVDFAKDSRERGVPEIDSEELRELLGKDPEAKLIDVREKGEWLCGRLPRAVHCSRGVIESNLETAAFKGRICYDDLEKSIVFYCGCGDRSLLVTERAMEMGFTNAASLEGGYKAWIASGGEVIVDPRFPRR